MKEKETIAGRAGDPENDGTDAKYITASKTAHRIKRKRCNPTKIGLHHLLYILLPYQHGAFGKGALILYILEFYYFS